ncbi:MAG: hypothetical protein ACMX3H_10310 [Sodalis sp. (in: enterobacteria)]|uniref:hypothetical protein n=1 Tax=Sodalis sp. (in: enterobacteria) TaxID=1898979 RepID=UPI0039E6F6CD
MPSAAALRSPLVSLSSGRLFWSSSVRPIGRLLALAKSSSLIVCSMPISASSLLPL